MGRVTHAAGVGNSGDGRGRRARPFVVAVAVTLLLISLSAGVAVGWRSQARGEGRQEFDIDASRAHQLVVERLQSTTDVVQETRSSFDDPDEMTSAEFERIVAGLLPDRLPSLATVSLIEAVAEDDLEAFTETRRLVGLDGFEVRSVEPGGAPPALATFEASTRGAPILQGYDLRGTPALSEALASRESRVVQITDAIERLPRAVLRVHPDLGQSAFALVAPARPGTWVLALVSGDELARQAAAIDDQLDVTLAIGGSVLGASTAGGVAVDLNAVPSDARIQREVVVAGGPLMVTVADIDGVAGGGWSEPGLLMGAGIALSVLVGSLIFVLARGRAGALLVASAAQQAQVRSEQHFRAVVQHLSDLVVVTDEALEIEFVTPSVVRLLGREATTLSQRPLIDFVHPDDRSLLGSLSGRPGVSDNGLIRFRHSDGAYRTFEVVVANRLDDPAIGGLVLTGHDVTDRVQLEDRLSHDATHDALTGLPNRALIRDRLEHALARADRTESRVAVVFGDLDDFKGVNDRHGHLVGDRLLAAVARRLRSAARAMDTVGRYAGDEFVVICEELDDEVAARHVAERLHHQAAQPIEVGGANVAVQMSLGVALAEPGETAESVIDRADRAMYRSKSDREIVFAQSEPAA